MKLGSTRPWLVTVGALALALFASPAAADEEERRGKLLDVAGSLGLPGLSHPGQSFSFESIVAASQATNALTEQILEDPAFSLSARWVLEASLIERSWFVGIMHALGAVNVPTAASSHGGGNVWLPGNPELWVRGLWSSRVGLAAGGGLAFVVPLPRSYAPLEADAVRSVRPVRGMDYPHFQDRVLTMRPFLDVRHVVGPVTLQIRQGLDFGVVLRDRLDNENRWDLVATTTALAHLRPVEALSLGLELQEVYQITADISSATCLAPCDRKRSQLTLSPSVRLVQPQISPSLSMLFPLSTPLRTEVADYIAGRLNVDVTF